MSDEMVTAIFLILLIFLTAFVWLFFCFLVNKYWEGVKGRNHGFAISFFFSPLIGIIIGLLLKPDMQRIEQQQIKEGTFKKCPFCAELIKQEAKVCRYCGKELPRIEQQIKEEASKKCPYCAELIKAEAKVCKYCGKDLPIEKM